MKKILGISLFAMMAVTTANAEIASKAFVEAQDNAVKELITSEATTRSEADTAITNKIGTIPTQGVGANSANVIAYVDAKVANANSGTTDAINALNATPSQAASAGNGQLALSVTQENGVITAVSGSITANTYDAYGTASTAETNAKAYADDLNTAMDARMDTAESNITTLQGDLNTASTGLKARMTTAESDISGLKAADTAINDKIGTIPNDPDTETPYADVVTYIGAVAGDVAALGDLAALNEVAEANLETSLAAKINAKQNAAIATSGDAGKAVVVANDGTMTISSATLGSAAYTDTGAYDVAGAATTAEANAKAYTDAQMNGTTGTLVKHTANTAAGSATNPVYIAADGTATAITSYSYNNLTDKPTIGNGTMTVSMNGASVGTFDANATEAATINLGNVITAPGASCTDLGAKCVLVVGSNGYAWEVVERGTTQSGD